VRRLPASRGPLRGRELADADPQHLDLVVSHALTLAAWGRACMERADAGVGVPLLERAEALLDRASREAPDVPAYRRGLVDVREALRKARASLPPEETEVSR
jgi:hypothetical protein